jgi:hypothetical protein
VLSFSDSDLAAFAAGWHLARAGDPAFPALRLANLAALEHPLSVDTYVEQTLDAAGAGAGDPDPPDRRGIVVALWPGPGGGAGAGAGHRLGRAARRWPGRRAAR